MPNEVSILRDGSETPLAYAVDSTSRVLRKLGPFKAWESRTGLDYLEHRVPENEVEERHEDTDQLRQTREETLHLECLGVRMQ